MPTTVQGYGAPVRLLGVEIANLNANNNALTALGTTGDDVITYTPTGASTGTFTNEGLNTVFNFSVRRRLHSPSTAAPAIAPTN